MAANPDLLRGALEAVLLEVISGGKTYGYEIARAIQAESGGELLTQEGTLYPALHRLEKRGLLRAHWELSAEGRKRKHYELTANGRKHLEALRSEWSSFSQVINRLLGLAHLGIVAT